MLIDSHAHMTFSEYEDDLEDVIQRSFASNIKIINASNNYESSRMAVALAEKYDGMWALVGCHPDDLKKEDIKIDKYKELAQSSKQVVGIGEVGLDFYRLTGDVDKTKSIQKQVFKKFINLAKNLDLPLVLHCRGEEKDPYSAYNLMLEILSSELNAYSSKLNGVIHCYGGTLVQVKEFLNLGFYIGFTGIVTFKNATDLQGIAKQTPLDRILIETDAPFLAPEPFRGKRNEPAYVKYVAQKIALLKEIDLKDVEQQTYNNTVKLFNLKYD